jgi:hypothetical protein
MGLIRLRWGLLILLAVMAPLIGSCGGSTQPNPTPIITAIFPDSITAGSAMFTVNLTGQGFLSQPQTIALWNGSPRTTTFNVTTGQIAITILAADVTNASVGLISAANPPPGGGTSTGVSFKINALQNQAPMNISLSPSSANAGTKGPFTLTVNGTNFVAGSIIRFNGTFRQPTSVSPTALTTDLTTTDLALAGFATVSVDNPLPGGAIASSISVDFTIGSGNAANTSATQVISVNAAGGPADGTSAAPAISADGRFVTFYSMAKNLVSRGGSGNIFVRDTCLGAGNCIPHTVAADLAPDGSPPNARASAQVTISGDGRFVGFASYATNLVAESAQSTNDGDRAVNGGTNLSLFVRDLCEGANVPAGCKPHTEMLARGADGPSHFDNPASLSGDGRYAAFASVLTSLVAGKAVNQGLVYVRDSCAGPTANVACAPRTILLFTDGSDPASGGQQSQPKISSTGRYVAFQRLVADGSMIGDRASQIFLRDTCLGADAPAACVPSTFRISVAPDGTSLEGLNASPSLSADARFVVFESRSAVSSESEMAAPRNIFLRDTCLGATAPDGCLPSTSLIYSEKGRVGDVSQSPASSISPSGRFISFVVSGSGSSQNAAASGSLSIYDTCFGATTVCTPGPFLVSVPAAGQRLIPLTLDRIAPVPLTADGRYAAFYSIAATDPATPVSGRGDVFLTATAIR